MADGDAPVQADIAAMPGWKRDVDARANRRQAKEARWIDIHEDDLDEAQMTKWIRQAAALPGWLQP